jgi:hypothetical protein
MRCNEPAHCATYVQQARNPDTSAAACTLSNPQGIAMKSTRILAIGLTSFVLALGTTGARADNTADDASFSGMWRMDYIDVNKDGMMSKDEFLALMGKVWDMKTKEMKVKGDKMNAEEMKALGRWLSRGERN